MPIVTVLAVILFSLFVTTAISAQDGELSVTAKLLKQQVVDGNTRAILQAAETGDKTLIPYLKLLSSDVSTRRNSNHPAFNAHIALAKLGDPEASQQILTDVDHSSPAVQDNAMHKLSKVGGKIAFRKFYELLDDSKPRENPDCLKPFEVRDENNPQDKRSAYCDVVYFLRSVTSLYILRSMVKDPPTRRFSGAKKEIDLWKEWIKKNGYLIN